MKHLNHHYSCQHLQVTILSLLLQELRGAIVTFEQGSFSFENSSEQKLTSIKEESNKVKTSISEWSLENKTIHNDVIKNVLLINLPQ